MKRHIQIAMAVLIMFAMVLIFSQIKTVEDEMTTEHNEPTYEVETGQTTKLVVANTTELITTTEPITENETKSTTTFRVTSYCACVNCCGKSDGITASGTKATQGRTIAADPNYYPYGTKIRINGVTYVVEDCGGAIKGSDSIDLYFDNHQDASNWGVQYLEGEVICTILTLIIV